MGGDLHALALLQRRQSLFSATAVLYVRESCGQGMRVYRTMRRLVEPRPLAARIELPWPSGD
jgi:hypothetical protein